MWGDILLVNSILLALTSTYLVYTIGAMILLGQWKIFVITVIFWVFLVLVQMALAAIIEP